LAGRKPREMRWLTREQTAEQLGVSLFTVDRWIGKGDLDAIRLPPTREGPNRRAIIRIDARSVTAMIEANRSSAAAEA